MKYFLLSILFVLSACDREGYSDRIIRMASERNQDMLVLSSLDSHCRDFAREANKTRYEENAAACRAETDKIAKETESIKARIPKDIRDRVVVTSPSIYMNGNSACLRPMGNLAETSEYRYCVEYIQASARLYQESKSAKNQ